MPRAHSETRRAYWRVVKVRTPGREQVLARLETGYAKIFVQSLARHLRQFEPHWSTGLSLADIGAVNGVAIGCHVIDPERDDLNLLSIARLNSVKSRVRRSSSNLARMDHTCPGRNGGFGPVSLPLFHAGRRGPAIGNEGLLSFMVSFPFERPPSLRWRAPDHRFHGSFRAGFAVAWLFAAAAARQSVTKRRRHLFSGLRRCKRM